MLKYTYRKLASLAKDDSLEIYTPEQSYILEAGTKTEKKAWLQKLRTRIAMALHGAEATEKNEIGNNEKTGVLISVNRGYLLGLEILKYSLVLMLQKPG